MDVEELKLMIAAIKEERERIREEEVTPMIEVCRGCIARIEATFPRAEQSPLTQNAIDLANKTIDEILAKP